MKTMLINIGFGNAVVAQRVIAVITPQSASGKRIREEAKENSLLIDATQGRKTRAIIIMDSNHIILSAMQPETLAGRLINQQDAKNGEDDTDE
jgi:extracellular matrix regulatory protein A